ncbi:MAG: glycosyltransferase family 4 protein [Chloroflexi bacterium]|nr:glycosyltransferase family 4 protein [Chloroflexota bacterium]
MTQKKELKVALVAPTWFKYQTGGGARYPWELAQALSSYAQVTLVSFASGRVTNRVSNTLTVEEFPAFYFLRPLFDRQNPLPLSLTFLKILRESDLVHINQFGTLVSAIAVAYCHFKDKPIFASYHGGRGLAFTRPFPFLGKWVDEYLLVCRYMFRMFSKYGRECRAIYVGTDTHKFRPLSGEKEKGKVLFVGRLHPIKGVEHLIDAVADLDGRLYVAGPSQSQQYLRALQDRDKGGKVIFLGRQDDQALAHHYNTAVVTVMPSVYTQKWWSTFPQSDLMPAVLLESMACGTTVIGTEVAGLPEVIQDGETGFIVPSGQPEVLKERIACLLKNPEVARKMGQRARDVVQERFTWDAVAQRCLEAYSGRMARNHGILIDAKAKEG